MRKIMAIFRKNRCYNVYCVIAEEIKTYKKTKSKNMEV